MEHAPCVVQTVTLGEGIAPLEGVEVGHPLSVLQLSAHQLVLGVVQVLVVHGTFAINLNLRFGLAQCLAQFVDAPVVERIFQGAGCAFANLVIRHIAQAVVGFPLVAAA